MLSKRLFFVYNCNLYMDNIKIYTEDLMLAEAILNRDEVLTKRFFYKDCYPMFYSIYKNYCTDSNSCIEFINEIYLLVLLPNPRTGLCHLQKFRGKSSLQTWLKTVCLCYCYGKYKMKQKMPIFEPLPAVSDIDSQKNDVDSDRNVHRELSNDIDLSSIDKSDISILLAIMPNRRYAKLIEYVYVELYSYEDAASALGMSMDNFYNKHLLAKKQFLQVYSKEENYEK